MFHAERKIILKCTERSERYEITEMGLGWKILLHYSPQYYKN